MMLFNVLGKGHQRTNTDVSMTVNPALVNLLAPTVFSDESKKANECFVGSKHRSISFIKDYDALLDPNWGAPLFEREGSITTYVMRPTNRESLKSSIDHSNSRQGVVLAQGTSASKADAAERAKEHGNIMLQLMGDSNESFFETAIFQTTTGESSEALRTARTNLNSIAAGKHLTMATCDLNQEGAYVAASPYWVTNKDIWAMYARDMCASTIAASLPFQDNSLDDGVGTLFGYCEPSKSPCRLNTTERTPLRNNSNVFLSGSSGSGKTFAASKIIMSEWVQGARAMVIDPERQFKTFCSNGSGQWINAGGGCKKDKQGRLRGACFSPLQPRLGNFSLEEEAAVSSTEEAYASDTQEVLRATLTFFHGWAELAWSTTSDDTALLDHGLIEAYKKYDIDFTTTASDLKEDFYPVMEDLKECYLDLASKETDLERKRKYLHLADKAEQCCENGIYGNLWAFRTNIDVTNDLVVFDTYELMEGESHVRTAQLFSILSWIWTQACVSRVTKQFLRVFVDEFHLIFGGGTDKISVTAAIYLNMIQKRIRKYNGGLMVATQQLIDALGQEVRRYGESMLTSSTYKLFFHTDTTDLQELTSIMSLTETVKNKIESDFKRGDCLLCAGSARAQVHIEAERFELDFINLEAA